VIAVLGAGNGGRALVGNLARPDYQSQNSRESATNTAEHPCVSVRARPRGVSGFSRTPLDTVMFVVIYLA